MTAERPRRRFAAAAVVGLLAVSCGGSESSGLPTLVEAATTASAIDPEQVEPVSEPTAVADSSSETAPTAETLPVVAGEREPGTDTGSAATASEPASTTGEVPAESDNNAGEAPSEPASSTSEALVETGQAAVAEPAEPAVEERTSREDLTDEERLLDFAACMRDNGVDFPDPVMEADGTITFGARPGGGGGGLAVLREIARDPDLPAARSACEGLLEGASFGPGQGGIDLVEIQDSLLEFARCMRDHGVDIGDPDMSRLIPGPDDDGQPGGPFGEIDTDDPDFAPAFAVCQQQLPTGPRLSGGR